MTAPFLFDAALAVLVVAVAFWIVAARDDFAAVGGFLALGLLLSLVWVRLAAPDVALTEAAIGSGVTGALLVAASARLRRAQAPAAFENPRGSPRIAAAFACALVSAALAALVMRLPEPPPSLAPLAAARLALTGLGNPVTAALMAYRAVDTLLEVVVLLLALLGVWSLVPDRFWGGRPGPRQYSEPDGVMAFFARLAPPIGILVAVHLFWVGSVAPGGEFQSASVLAAMWILVWTAGLVDMPPIERRWLRLALIVGPATFLAIGFAGLALAGGFLAYPPEYAKLLILLIEAPVTLSIAAALALLVAGSPEQRASP